MDWAAIISAVLAAIAECRKKQTHAAVYGTLRSGGLGCRFTLRQIGRDKGLQGRDLRMFVSDGLDELDRAPDAALVDLIKQAETTAGHANLA